MAIKTIRIHPAIGIARVGNSPTDFFIGPEAPGVDPAPPGGFKDASCRVKRQAARFRLYGYDENDVLQGEITTADATIAWTVHLANRKAAAPNYSFPSGLRNPGVTGAARDKLVIDPGPRTLNGGLQQAWFDTGTFTVPPMSGPDVTATVPLGEARTDAAGRLLVLGGFGHSGSPDPQSQDPDSSGSTFNHDRWFDDVSDGPITASVTLQGTSMPIQAEGAWVIVTPPKFAPGLDSMVTLWDRLSDHHGWGTEPASPSFTNDVYPILRRARDIRWVEAMGGFPDAHASFDPSTFPLSAAQRATVFGRLRNPAGGGGSMPVLAGGPLGDGDNVTPRQYRVMQKWSAGTFTNDWSGVPVPPPAITPAGLDRAALDACVGAAFYPGIEAGEFLLDTAIWSAPFRLKHGTVKPGDVTAHMALPWQTDFFACGVSWWPVARPNAVMRGGVPQQSWTGGLVASDGDMVAKWHALGFVVEQSGQYVETERCDLPSVTLLTPSLDFHDVPQGPGGMARTTYLPIVFEVVAPTTPVTLEWVSGPMPAAFQRGPVDPLPVPPTGTTPTIARMWIAFTTGGVGSTVNGTVRVRVQGTTTEWNVTLTARTVARKVADAALVLDRSGSMSDDRGDGQPKIAALRQAAGIFVDVMLEGDGVSVVRYNQDAQAVGGRVTLGPPPTPSNPISITRDGVKGTIDGPDLAPGGSTSIGDGIFEGRNALATSTSPVKALVVMTDGLENQPRWIHDVASSVDEQTFAVGLGTPQNTSAAALQALTGNHGGYLLVTGAITAGRRFVLTKYFLQILAGVSNAEVLLDPEGTLVPGMEARIPIHVCEADGGLDVILLADAPEAIDFRLRSPQGDVIDPAVADARPDIQFVRSRGVGYYRMSLPFAPRPQRPQQEGTWHALLRLARYGHAGEQAAFVGRTREFRYALLVHAYSELTFRPWLAQASHEPGRLVQIGGTVTEFGMPVATASVRARITTPDGTVRSLTLSPTAAGEFRGDFTTTIAGVYDVQLRATGRTARGVAFQREQIRTAFAWSGADRTPQPGEGVGDRDRRLCELLECVLSHGAITPELEKRARAAGLDIEVLRRCVARWCAPLHVPTSETPGREPPHPAAAEPRPNQDLVELLRLLLERR